jgi:hypothetical protein
MITNKKALKINDGIYVNMKFFIIKCTISKYFPGATAYIYTRRVIKTIQKFAATLNAILPIILIVQRLSFSLFILPSN